MYKLKITKAEFEALDDAKKALYIADGADKYKLDVDDVEVAAEMRRARDRETARSQELTQQLADTKERLEQLQTATNRKNGDLNAIEASWQQKVNEAKEAGDKAVKALKEQVKKLLVDSEISKLATEIFTKPNRDARLLKDRVTVDYDGETPALRVLDKDGKPSALTLADLRKEIVDNPDYSDILVGSRAGGSGGAAGNQGGGATKQPKDYTEAERIELHRTNPARFKELFPE